MKSLLFALLLPTLAAAAEPQDLAPEVRIQRRFLEKKRRFALYAGFAYHGRNDFYYAPGIEVALSFYVLESLAIDLRGALFLSKPTRELYQVLENTGYLPDTQPPQAAVMVGARYSLGYAKIRVSKTRVLHFEPQVFLYGGAHSTSGWFSATQAGPLFEVGLGFLIYPTKHFQMRLDGGLTIGGEQRTNYVAVVGGYPSLLLGAMF